MKNLFVLILTIFSFTTFGQINSTIKIINQKHLLELPSASGIEFINNDIFIVGDDSPFLFQLDDEFSILDKISLTGNDSIHNGRVPWQIKSDFESMAYFTQNNENFLAVLSSGSKQIFRDSIHIFSLNETKIKTSKNIRPLFESIKSKANFTINDEINIEALAINNSNVFMMQRGNNNENLVISIDKKIFLNYLNKKNAKVPPIKIYKFKLPTFENTISGFSGVCVLPLNKGLLFTASLEATTDAISDGEILGSYLGIIEFTNFDKGITDTKILKEDNKILKTKLEGITVKSIQNNKVNVICVSDNDDGTSWIYELEFVLE